MSRGNFKQRSCGSSHAYSLINRILLTLLLCLASGLATAEIQVVERTTSSAVFFGVADGSGHAFYVDSSDIPEEGRKLVRVGIDGNTDSRQVVDTGTTTVLVSQRRVVFSDDGRFAVWVNWDTDAVNEGVGVYDFQAQQFVSLTFDEGDFDHFDNLQFLSDSHQLALLRLKRGSSVFVRRSDGIQVIDLLSGSSTLLTADAVSDADTPIEGFSSFRFSGDGSALVFLDQSDGSRVLYHHDFDTGETGVIGNDLAFLEFRLLDISTDGQKVVYVRDSHFSDIELVLKTVNVPREQVVPLSQPVSYVDGSDDLNRILIEGGFDFSDGRSRGYIQSPQGLSGLIIREDRRNDALSVLDMTTGQRTQISRLSNYHNLKSRPLGISADGNHVTAQIEIIDLIPLSASLIRETIDFNFRPDAAVSGLWYQQSAPGQGLSVHVVPDQVNTIGKVIVVWNTVDSTGEPLWVYMEGYFDGNAVSGQAYTTRGSRPGMGFNPAEAETAIIGQLSLTFDSCKSARLDYTLELANQEIGSIDLNRLAYQYGVGCL